LSVGNDDIDLQHRRLLETANKVMSLSDDQDEAFFCGPG